SPIVHHTVSDSAQPVDRLIGPERCSLLIALAWAAGSACSHRRRDAGRGTPVYLLDLRRPSDGRRARRVWRRARCAASAEITLPALMTSGLACLSASLLVRRIRRLAPAIVPAV